MLASSIPAKIPLPFANSGTKNTIPTASQISVTPGAASLTDGFPPLTFTPVASGGIPPFGADFNGILYEITAIQQWQCAGGVFYYDSAFSTAIGGYPKGAILQSSDGSTEWLNLADNNTTNPDATDGSAANWASLASYGLATVSGLTSSNVTLTPAQYGKHIIVLSGTLAGSINIIFPTSQRQWQIVNNCTMGSYNITAKTASGSGVLLVSGTQGIWGDGTNIYSAYSTQSTQASIQGEIKNFKSAVPGLNSYTTVLTADEAVLENGSNAYMTVRSVNLTVNANGTVGAPLSVTSARAASTWYYRWLWYNATNGLTAMLDTSSAAPTAPTGYVSTDYKCRLPGASRTDSSANQYLLQIETLGKVSQYVVTASSNTATIPLLASGTGGSTTTPTWVAAAWGNAAPPTAASLKIYLTNATSGSEAMAAPNANYGAQASTTNAPPLSTGNSASIQTFMSVFASMLVESSNVYYASNASGAFLACMGWEEA